MEQQVVTITIVTKGEKCEMSNQEILDWYRTHISGLFNPDYGVPEIDIALKRVELE